MEDQADFGTLQNGLYNIIGHPTNTSLSSSVSQHRFAFPGTTPQTQSAPSLQTPWQVNPSFPSMYIFHPSLSNPYMNPHQDSAYNQTFIPPPHYIPMPPLYHSFPVPNEQSNMYNAFPSVSPFTFFPYQNGAQGIPLNTYLHNAPPPANTRPLPTAPPPAIGG